MGVAGVMLRSAPQPDNLAGESQLCQTLAYFLCKGCPINKILARHSTLSVQKYPVSGSKYKLCVEMSILKRELS